MEMLFFTYNNHSKLKDHSFNELSPPLVNTLLFDKTTAVRTPLLWASKIKE